MILYNVERRGLIGRLKRTRRIKHVLEGHFQIEERQERRNTRGKHVPIIEVEQ